ncbi:hypothetical protein [Methylomicrobium sp. Wu6]|nr:hypothetical protein [Methylomicrobium sp. Wu6]MEC4747271.1 hypothetical protein [Methylomicrobium sp. Wu6]
MGFKEEGKIENENTSVARLIPEDNGCRVPYVLAGMLDALRR